MTQRFLVLLFFSIIAAAFAAQARKGERLQLEPNTMAELTVMLSAGDALHGGLTKQDDEQVDVALRDIELATRRTISVSARLKPYVREHLVKVLEVIESNVGAARNSGHIDRRERISDIFNMMANLVRVYSVDARFKIFFCGRDKMTWIQTKPNGVYPFNDSREPAGERNCALRAP
ncbi:hypothetical protein BH10BDE1_BH10BDE1_30440 [soil metagenome]